MTTIMLALAINIHTKLNKYPIKRLLELRSEKIHQSPVSLKIFSVVEVK